MWKQPGTREDSDDDMNKCSDDAVNVAKSKLNKSVIYSVLNSKVKFVCTVITIVVSVTILIVIFIGNPIINLQSREDMLMLSDQLKSVLTNMDDYCDSYDTFKRVNLCKDLEEQHRNLKTRLQMAEAEIDAFTCDEPDFKGHNPSKLICLSASSTNNIYGCVYGNRTIYNTLTDTMHIMIIFKLAYLKLADGGKVFFEFGLTPLVSGRLNIIVRGKRCTEEPGLCLYVLDTVTVWTKLEHVVYEQISAEYVQIEIQLELHQSNFVLLSNRRNIFISKTSNELSENILYPVFGFYNTHLIDISLTMFSEKGISFDVTTVDPHLFISEDNTTLSTSNPDKRNLYEFIWGCTRVCIPITVFTTCFYFLSRIIKWENDNQYIRKRYKQ